MDKDWQDGYKCGWTNGEESGIESQRRKIDYLICELTNQIMAGRRHWEDEEYDGLNNGEIMQKIRVDLQKLP